MIDDMNDNVNGVAAPHHPIVIMIVIVVVGAVVVVEANNDDPYHEVDHERSQDKVLEGGMAVVTDDEETIETVIEIDAIDRGPEEERHQTTRTAYDQDALDPTLEEQDLERWR